MTRWFLAPVPLPYLHDACVQTLRLETCPTPWSERPGGPAARAFVAEALLSDCIGRLADQQKFALLAVRTKVRHGSSGEMDQRLKRLSRRSSPSSALDGYGEGGSVVYLLR